MAIDILLKQEEASSANTQAYTGSVVLVPTSSKQYMLIYKMTRGSTLSVVTPTVVHSASVPLVFSEIVSSSRISQAENIAAGHKLFFATASCDGTQTPGVLIFEAASSAMSSHQYAVLELSNVDQSNPIPQTSGNSINDNAAGALSASAFPVPFGSTSYVVSVLSTISGSTLLSASVPPNFTQLLNTSNTAPPSRLMIAYRNVPDSSSFAWTDMDTSATLDSIIANFEIKAGEIIIPPGASRFVVNNLDGRNPFYINGGIYSPSPAIVIGA